MCVGFAWLLAISTSQGNVCLKEGESCESPQGKDKEEGGDGNGRGLQDRILFYTLRLYYPPIDNACFVSRNRRLLNFSPILPNLSLQVFDPRFNLLQ